MMPIRIVSLNFEFKAEIDNYESMMFTRSWSGIGELEMRINKYKKHTEHLLKGNLIVISPQKVFLIKHREIELNEEGKASENWLIKALDLKAITGQRQTLPPSHTAYDNKQGNAETVMKHYVDGNIINPVDVNRKIDQVLLAANLNRGPSVSWQSRFKNLAEELTEISLITGIGWGMTLDFTQNKFVFDVQEGRNLTAGQDILPPVIFSPQFESLKSLQYTESEINYKNAAYVGGQGEGTARRIIEIGDSSGLDRHEIFIDARDVEEKDENDLPIPESEIIQTLTERGQQQLNEFLQEQYLEGQIMTPIRRNEYERYHHFVSPFQSVEKVTKKTRVIGSFIYEEDYDIGDIVTIQNTEWGVTMDARITEIKEIYESDGFKLEAVFGNNQPTLIKKFKQQFSQIGAEVRK